MSVVIVGGGLAGLSAAAVLAARGHAVRVLEAAPDVGGKARAVEAAGARIDLGPTILTDLAPWRALFAAGGDSLERAVSLVRLDPALTATFGGGPTIALHRDPARLASALAALGPHAQDDWTRVLALGERAARLSAHFYAHGDVAGPADALRFVLGRGVRLDDVSVFARHGSLARLVDVNVRTPELRRLLHHCARFLGLDADRAPAVALVIPYLFATDGIWYPLGGVSALAEAVRDLAVKHGASIETNCTVTRLELSGNRVTAVITADARRLRANACVAAVDAALTAHWIGHEAAALGTPTHAARVAWWVAADAPRRPVHHAFHFDDVDAHPVYVAAPTVTEPTLAPAGASLIHALVHGRPGIPADDAFAVTTRKRLIRADAWPTGRILAHGVAGGATSCYGPGIGPGLLASFRPSQRVRGVANLVRAGASVFPGPGLANVVRSGLRAAEHLDEAARA
jgi:phytoene dehydrogenase-like protein